MSVQLIATDQHNSVLRTQSRHSFVSYLPFGLHRESQTVRSRLAFNGQYKEAPSCHYLLGSGYRTYNPLLMRFNSPDSISPFGKGGLNCYAYGKSDPVNYLDPTGHMPAWGAARTAIPIDDLQLKKLWTIHHLLETDPDVGKLLGTHINTPRLKTRPVAINRPSSSAIPIPASKKAAETTHSRLLSMATDGAGQNPDKARAKLQDAYLKASAMKGDVSENFNYLKAEEYDQQFKHLLQNPELFSGYKNNSLFENLVQRIRA